MINELKKQYANMKILKQYPKSGQKEVFLVEVDDYGIVVLKIIRK